MKKFKQVEKRRFLYEASKQTLSRGGKSYDALYHTYAHYMLVRTKLTYGIFS